MKFKELLRREALAACAVAIAVAVVAVGFPALAQTSEPAAPMDQHHGNKRLMREMAKTDGDPTGEAAVPHHRDSAFAVVQASDVVTGHDATEADRLKEPQRKLDMKLYKFKDD